MKNKLKVSNINKFRFGQQYWWNANYFLSKKQIVNIFLVINNIVNGLSRAALLFIFSLYVYNANMKKKKWLHFFHSYCLLFLVGLKVNKQYELITFLLNYFQNMTKKKKLRTYTYYRYRKHMLVFKRYRNVIPELFVYQHRITYFFSVTLIDIFTLFLIKKIQKKKYISFKFKFFKMQLLFFFFIRIYLEKFLKNLTGAQVLVTFHNQFFRMFSQNYWSRLQQFVKRSKLVVFKNKIFRRFFYLVFISILERNMSLLAKYFVFFFQQGRYQHQILNKLKYILNIILNMGLGVIGFKILIYGKSKQNPKTSIKHLDFGHDLGLKLQNYTKYLYYGFNHAETYKGSFGIHIWMMRRPGL